MKNQTRRVGIMVPAPNITVEQDYSHALQQLNQKSVFFHYARMRSFGDMSISSLKTLTTEAISEASKFARVALDVLVFACTGGSFLEGTSFEEELRKKIGKVVPGVPILTAAGSSVSALEYLGAKKIAFVSPYAKDLHIRGVMFFVDSGFKIVKENYLDLPSENIAFASIESIRELIERVRDKSLDAVFVSCTGFPVFLNIQSLEIEFGVPIVSSNQAILWDILRHLNVSLEGFGTLFSKLVNRR